MLKTEVSTQSCVASDSKHSLPLPGFKSSFRGLPRVSSDRKPVSAENAALAKMTLFGVADEVTSLEEEIQLEKSIEHGCDSIRCHQDLTLRVDKCPQHPPEKMKDSSEVGPQKKQQIVKLEIHLLLVFPAQRCHQVLHV